MHDLILRNCQPELAITNGVIEELNPSETAPSRATLDADGQRVHPGLVDEHVHFNEPGRTDWEGFETGSRAAFAGGVTTLFDMPLNSHPPVLRAEDVLAKRHAGEAHSQADFAIWGGLTPENLDEVPALAEAGVIGFKSFISPSGIDEFDHIDWDSLDRGMAAIAKTGLRLALHAEDPACLMDNPDWEQSRPPEAEASAIRRAAAMARAHVCPILIVHVSCAEGLDAVAEARAAGTDIRCETCPHYLLLDRDCITEKGATAKCAPPLRARTQVDQLWQRLDEIDTIGSDHSPCPSTMKQGPFEQAWGGISGIQHGFVLCWSDAYEAQLIERMSTRPAALFGLQSKGELRVGGDADLFLFRPGPCLPIQADELLYRHAHSPYVGLRPQGQITTTLLRGQTANTQGRWIPGPLYSSSVSR